MAVAAYLRVAITPPVFWTSIDHGAGKLSAAAAGNARGRGCKPGIPDLMVFQPIDIGKDGPLIVGTRVIAIELKSRIGRLRDVQVTTHLALRAAGVHCHVARSVDEVEAILAHHDVPLRARSLPFKPGTQPAISPRPQRLGPGAER